MAGGTDLIVDEWRKVVEMDEHLRFAGYSCLFHFPR